MHKCVRCGRAAASLQEINDGCPCGSKVFVFNKEAVQNSLSIAGEEMPKPSLQPQNGSDGGGSPPGMAASAPGNGGAASPTTAPSVGSSPISSEKTVMAPGQKVEGISGGDGKIPESYHARMTFTSEDVENIKVVTEGVFMIELHSLYRDPVVLKDEEGIYYVKLPFEQKAPLGGNGKEKKEK